MHPYVHYNIIYNNQDMEVSINRWMNKDVVSVQFSCSVVSDSLWPHELQHTRFPCSSPTPGVHSDSRPLSWWCHPAISSSVVPFSSCPQSLPASVFSKESTLPMRWPKYWSLSFSIIPSKAHPGLISFRMDWLDLLAVQGPRKSLLQHNSSKFNEAKIKVLVRLHSFGRLLGWKLFQRLERGCLHSLAWGPFLHLQSCQDWAEPPQLPPLWFAFSSIFRDSCADTEPIWIIQDNLPI